MAQKARWYSSWAPDWAKSVLRHIWRDRITQDELENEMDAALQFPGVSNAWTMPIKARIDMLSTGIRTPVGIKIFGADLKEIEQIGEGDRSASCRSVPGTRSVFAERVAGGYFLDFDLKREQLARYGLTVEDANMMVMTAIGGETGHDDGRGARALSASTCATPATSARTSTKLRRVLVPSRRCPGPDPPGAAGRHRCSPGPRHDPRRERNAVGLRLRGLRHVRDIDVGGYVDEAKKAVARRLQLPTGYSLAWSGQYENMLRVRERLKVVIPVTLFLIFVLLYMNTKSAIKTAIVMLAVPFSLIGAVWFLWFLGYNMSIAVWVGMIALMGLDAETGVFMLLFLDLVARRVRRRAAADTTTTSTRRSSTAPSSGCGPR